MFSPTRKSIFIAVAALLTAISGNTRAQGKFDPKLLTKGRDAIFLSDDAALCIQSTTVYDNAGHFEFVNLMPGEYLLYTESSFTNTRSYTEVTGYY